jgi:alpha-L-fucosidase 2
LRARGGFQIDLDWSNGALESAVLRSDLGNKCVIRTDKRVRITTAGQVVAVDMPDGDHVTFETTPGAAYRIEYRD